MILYKLLINSLHFRSKIGGWIWKR